MRIRILFGTFFIFFSFFSSSSAAPLIQGVSGTFEHGETITLSGSDFGNRVEDETFIFDTFESGTFQEDWASTYDLSVDSSDLRHPRSQYQAHNNFAEGTSQGRFQASRDHVYEKWFAQYWMKVDENWDWGTTGYDGDDRFLSNIKIFRLWNPSDAVIENFVVAFAGWGGSSFIYTVEHTGESGEYIYNATDMMSKGSWHLMQFQYGENSSPGAADGQFKFWLDGVKIADRDDMITRLNFDVLKRPFIIGFSAVWGPGSGESYQAPNDFYMDDVWMDNAWNRVEICPGETWAEKGKCEIQAISTWTDSSISIELNRGAFNSGDEFYVYVVDESGEVSPPQGPYEMGGEVDEVVESGSQDDGESGGVVNSGCRSSASTSLEMFLVVFSMLVIRRVAFVRAKV